MEQINTVYGKKIEFGNPVHIEHLKKAGKLKTMTIKIPSWIHKNIQESAKGQKTGIIKMITEMLCEKYSGEDKKDSGQSEMFKQ